MSVRREALIGAWALVQWRIESGDGRISYPFGQDATGQILYSADGAMSATVSASGRGKFSGESPRRAPDSELATAFRSYFHYAGAWHLDGDEVVHEVAFALNPSMVGTQQRRRVTFAANGELTLDAEESVGIDRVRRHVLVWRRAASAGELRCK